MNLIAQLEFELTDFKPADQHFSHYATDIIYYYYYYYYYYYFTLWKVFTSVLADGLSLEFEWHQVSRTLLSILAVLNNTVVWMVSTRPQISKSSSPFNNPLVTVPKAPITISIVVTFLLHSFFNSFARSRYLSFSHSFSFILLSAGTAKSTILQIVFLFCFYHYYYY